MSFKYGSIFSLTNIQPVENSNLKHMFKQREENFVCLITPLISYCIAKGIVVSRYSTKLNSKETKLFSILQDRIPYCKSIIRKVGIRRHKKYVLIFRSCV